MRHTARWVALVAATGCLTPNPTLTPHPAEILRGPTFFRNTDLTECSGLALSRRHPGIIWSHNDSDHEPQLFATDTLGRDLGTIRVAAAENQDWEDLATGPCGGSTCLYIGDIGDNPEQRPSITIYRVPEPALNAVETDPAVRLEIRYPDGPHDAEALYVDHRGDLYLITKGRTQGVRHYRVPAAMWERGAATAEPLGRLPLDPQGTLLDMVTGADLSPDGTRVAVRTYREIYTLPVTPDGRLARPPWPACNILGLESQGEGIVWLDNQTLVLGSEQGHLGPGTITVLRCDTR